MNSESKAHYNLERESYNSHGEQLRTSREAFIKHLLLMASSLLGILVALHKSPVTSDNIRIAFSVVVLSIALGVACLAVALYSQVDLHKKAQRHHMGNIFELRQDPLYDVKIATLLPSKIYVFFETAGYISLLIALCSLSTYAILVA